ncbi:hypothetical protein OCU04_004318 [Sclerotinia nivalis]|uniref:Uncharacterized protein n=1 Tax=Sclerotinia nivalis TaxID=352851 RepID=A0A9X0DL04_9HELO|nr:hypothetical protein OCU04_004318 [Sclerotinia nivalis]
MVCILPLLHPLFYLFISSLFQSYHTLLFSLTPHPLISTPFRPPPSTQKSQLQKQIHPNIHPNIHPSIHLPTSPSTSPSKSPPQKTKPISTSHSSTQLNKQLALYTLNTIHIKKIHTHTNEYTNPQYNTSPTSLTYFPYLNTSNLS